MDNRRQNLRIVSRSENAANQRKQAGCTSSYKGVWWDADREKWQAYMNANGKRIHLGRFASETEAAEAYNTAHRLHFPGINEGLNKISI
jgi:hypothetical protein